MKGATWVGCVILAAMLVFASSGVAADPFTSMGVLRLDPPTPAPPFALLSSDGVKLSLEALRGKVVLLYFGASW
jgi:cytochrome oxidase Cu insertion factor (SCO1/SenC/PrrC family)